MNRLAVSAAVATALLFTANAQAQSRRMERAQDRHELRQDARALQDDRRDLAELEDTLARFDRARATRNEHEMMSVESRLRELLREELAEGRAEIAKDKAEVRRDNREVRRDAAWGNGAQYANDRHDRRDDVRDARAEVSAQRTKRNIAWDLNRVMGSRRPEDLNRERGLMVELIALARQELHQDHQEMREDKRELREDRRESRQDGRWH